MRMLVPEPVNLATEDLVGLYDWPAEPWLRACMAMSLDGDVAGPDGRSGSLSSAVDRLVLAAVRARADAYLVGAATVRAERYSPVLADPRYVPDRLAAGQSAAATLVVVSASCRFPWQEARFQGSANPPIVLTTLDAQLADRRAASAAGCDVIALAGHAVDASEAVRLLRDRGLIRITVEGGPQLLRQLVRADLIDEADVTLSPTLIGGPRRGELGAAVLRRMRLAHLLEHDGFLFTRYLRPEGS